MLGRAGLLALCLTLLLGSTAHAGTLRAPVAQGPSKSATVQSLPAFTWRPVRGAAQYQFQLAADPRFRSIVLGTGYGQGDFRTRNTVATVEETVPSGTYYWRVRAISAKDKAGRWSPARTLVKAWTATPDLLTDDALAVAWPSQPLVLRWSGVPYATKYQVSIATDETLSNLIGGAASGKPIETQATVLALPQSLAAGRYFWAVTPVDARGHLGTRSRVRSFTWAWPNGTATRVRDLDPAPEVFDPQFSWDPIPGAARYEVEVNSAEDFAVGSKWCCGEATIGTSLSPTKPLANNRYYWRVRAIDSSDNAGQWNVGPSFDKAYDNTTPSVNGLTLRTPAGGTLPAGSATDAPIITWDPVPGAVDYELQNAPYLGFCDWSTAHDLTNIVIPAYTPLDGAGHFGSTAYPDPQGDGDTYGGGQQRCFRVLARTANDAKGQLVVGDWTQLGGSNQPAYTASDQPAAASSPPAGLPPADYLSPGNLARVTRTPLYTWNRLPGAYGYYVIVARDVNFTKIADVGYTRIPAYAPRLANSSPLSDETTHYYWYVVPTNSAHQYLDTPDNHLGDPAYRHAFDKASTPPSLLGPVNGSDVTSQPTFAWTEAEGAREYRLQVAQDPSFSNPIDDVTTNSIAYTSSSTYPADTVLYWRVRANDASGQGLNWSSAATFQRRLPAPVPAAGNPSVVEGIPVLSWSSVEGAVSYDVHVDQVDGSTRDFTLNSTSFAPVEWYGQGIWRWKVRANFATSGGRVSGAYSPLQTVLRTFSAPSGATATRTRTRVLIAWNPDPFANHYEVDISSTDGFDSIFASGSTDHTAWAPDLTQEQFAKGGTMHWRVASIDQGGNRSAYATGKFRIPRSMQVEASGLIVHRKTGNLVVHVHTATGSPLRGAKVTVSGLGTRRTAHRTSKRGVARFLVRPRRRGKLTIKVRRKGFQDTSITYRVT